MRRLAVPPAIGSDHSVSYRSMMIVLRSGETVTLTLVPSLTVTVRDELFFAALRQITTSAAALIHETKFFIFF